MCLTTFSGCTDVEQEVLRHKPEHELERSDRQLPGIHPVPQDPSQRADEGSAPTRSSALLHHHERSRLPGAVRSQFTFDFKID